MSGRVLTVNGTPYQVLRPLGKGKGGYSYLAQGPDGEQAVVKQIHHEPCAYYQFGDKLAAELPGPPHAQASGRGPGGGAAGEGVYPGPDCV